MSELAFDANGDPITFPADAEELRVRRFRNPGMRGACEVVHDREGAPLYVPVDTGYVDFRKLVDGVPGRYRLDPVDASRRVIANSVPAYITITEAPRAASSATAGDERDSVIRELARANADMTKTIADRFASVMHAAADLLRAADGAGLPKREPAAMPVTVLQPEPEDDEEEEEDDDDSPDVAALIAQVLPTIQMWLATKTADRSAAQDPAAAPAPAPVPAPASAAAPVQAAGEASAAAGMEGSLATGAQAATTSGSPAGPTPEAATGSSARAAGNGATTAPPGGGEPRNAVPTPAETAHLLAIYAQLSPDEKRIAQRVVTRMGPEVRARWLAELSALPVKDAVDLVRSMIPRPGSRKESDA